MTQTTATRTSLKSEDPRHELRNVPLNSLWSFSCVFFFFSCFQREIYLYLFNAHQRTSVALAMENMPSVNCVFLSLDRLSFIKKDLCRDVVLCKGKKKKRWFMICYLITWVDFMISVLFPWRPPASRECGKILCSVCAHGVMKVSH